MFTVNESDGAERASRHTTPGTTTTGAEGGESTPPDIRAPDIAWPEIKTHHLIGGS